MYPATFVTNFLLLVFCHFGATEPPPSHGYGPPSPVEFGSNEIGSHEQYGGNGASAIDFGNYNTFGSASQPSGYAGPSSAYKSGPSSFSSPHFGGSANYKNGGGGGVSLGHKGGVSSSYISIVHGAGQANGPSKLRPATYSVPSKGPAPVINSYSPPSFGNAAAAFTDVRSFGGVGNVANPYSSGEVFSNGYAKFGAGVPSAGGNSAAAYGASYESYSPASADYNKAYENSGGLSDEVASYTSGGPSYATLTGSSKLSFSPNLNHGGSRGNAFSTSNVNVFGSKGGGHAGFHAPSYTGNVKLGGNSAGGAKVYSRYTGPSNFGSSSGGGASYSSPSLGSGESGYNSRALKAGYGIENAAEEFGSSEDSNIFNGAFSDGAGFKVQSSYSTRPVDLSTPQRKNPTAMDE